MKLAPVIYNDGEIAQEQCGPQRREANRDNLLFRPQALTPWRCNSLPWVPWLSQFKEPIHEANFHNPWRICFGVGCGD